MEHSNDKSKSQTLKPHASPSVPSPQELANQDLSISDKILQLQQTIGNSAVQRILKTSSNPEISRDSHGNGCKCLACSGIQRYAEAKSLQRESEQHGKGCTCASCSGGEVQRKVDPKLGKQTKPESDSNDGNSIGYDSDLLQRQIDGDATLDEFLTHMDTESNRKLTDHMPSTGLGRFDAEYLPRTGKLKITVKAFLDFGDKGIDGNFQSGLGGWKQEEKQTFIDNFKNQTEAAWSGKFTFKPKKAGFTDIVAKPDVKFVSVDNVDDAHFHHKIAKTMVMNTGIGREQHDDTNPSRVNIGNFTQGNQDVGPQGKSICGRIGMHDYGRIKNLLKAYKVNPIKFKSNGSTELDKNSKIKVKAFADRLLATSRPGSVPVPLIATGSDTWWERKVGKPKAAARATTAKSFLEGVLAGSNPVTTNTIAEEVLTKAKTRYEKTKKEKGKDHAFTKEDKGKYDDAATKFNQQQVIIDPDEQFAMTWKGDAYSTLAHEFGHMLGNPDEYFDYGSDKIKDSKVKQLVESGTKDDLLKAQYIQGLKSSGDDSKAGPQEAFAKLATDAGQTIPEFGPTTSSIMSAGADVLPVHYVPLLEALSLITKDALPYAEWNIE